MGFQFDLRHRSLIPYVLTYFLTLIFFPGFRIFFSSPLMAAALYRLNWNRYLWFGLWAGVLLDVLSSDYPIGFHGATFLLTCVGLSSLKQHFFSDSLSTLPIMTFFASLLQGITAGLLAPIFDLHIRFSIPWIFTDLLCMPIFDGIAAFLLFIVVPMLFQSRSRRRQDYFMKDRS